MTDSFPLCYAPWFRERLKERFLRYAAFPTPSDRKSQERPSSKSQRQFAQQLLNELKKLRLSEVFLDENCYLYGLLKANRPTKQKPLALLAHLDISADAPCLVINPIVHPNYHGQKIKLSEGIVLDAASCPELNHYQGSTIITSDGTSLLGADDKAGIALIVTLLEFFNQYPDVPHASLEFVFTPDEEIGRGIDYFPLKRLKARYCLTLDGSGDGVIEAECFSAWASEIVIKGRPVHLGEARGKLLNALEVISRLVCLLPQTESPQTTDGREGFYAPVEIEGNLQEAKLLILIRDFDERICQHRLKAVRKIVAALMATYPGVKIEIKERKQYTNMKNYFKARDQRYLNLIVDAVKMSGAQPIFKSIRGGTDGARLSAQGRLTPNLFNGGFNFHSQTEWLSLEAMTRSALTILALSQLWLTRF